MAPLHIGERRRSPRAGFTLLELLISLCLMSLLTVVILGALGTGARVWEHATVEQQVVEETVVARKFLRRWLEQAYPLSFRYFGTRDEDGEPPRWSDAWRAQTRLPRVIAIDLETTDGRRRSWSFRLRDGG